LFIHYRISVSLTHPSFLVYDFSPNVTYSEMKVLTDEKRGNLLIQCPLNLHFLAAWIKFDILFTIILIKRGNLLIRGKLSSLLITRF